MYLQKNWDEAIDCFTEAQNFKDDDLPTKMFIQRCSTYRKEPPAKNWNGVFKMKIFLGHAKK